MKKIPGLLFAFTLITMPSVYATGSVANQSLIDLNTQIQQQLQQIQAKHNQSLEQMNIKIQAQLAQLQKTLQEEILQEHAQVQKQIQTMQSDLQKEIHEVANANAARPH